VRYYLLPGYKLGINSWQYPALPFFQFFQQIMRMSRFPLPGNPWEQRCIAMAKIYLINLMLRHLLRSRDSSVNTATGYRLGGRGSIPGRGKRFFSNPQRLDRLWGPPSILCNGYLGLFYPGANWQGRKADHSPPSTAEIKNGGAIPQFPFMS
jgi:hypothetical protein